MTRPLLFTGGRILDPRRGDTVAGEVLVEGGRIRVVSQGAIEAPAAERVELAGRVLMPGLIDCHVHVASTTVDGRANVLAPSSLTAMRARRNLETILRRGFTTVRDCGGADLGLVMALDEGLVDGPRLVICDKGFSMTGGHGDQRGRTDVAPPSLEDRLGALMRIVDGVEGLRLASREAFRRGAQFIKILANGGVSSPTDPIEQVQYSRDEIRTVVEEAENANSYVSAHLYTDRAIRRAVACGVHSLEHCNLIEAETAHLAAQAGAIAVPTLVAYEALKLEGTRFGLAPEAAAKIETVREAGVASLAVMRDAGLKMAFGSDLLGELQTHHSTEFAIRARVLTPIEIIRSATLIGAELCRMAGEIGEMTPGARADMIIVDGDPLNDIALLAEDGRGVRAVLRDGRFVAGTGNPF